MYILLFLLSKVLITGHVTMGFNCLSAFAPLNFIDIEAII
jgi:hypothetical protein